MFKLEHKIREEDKIFLNEFLSRTIDIIKILREVKVNVQINLNLKGEQPDE